MFDKLIQVLRFGCSYEAIADTVCSATTIRNRRDEWSKAGLFAQLKQIALDAYDRIVGLTLDQIAVDGCITNASGGGRARRPVPGRPAQTRHETVADGRGSRHPARAGTGRRQPPRLAAAVPLPDDITVHLDSGHDSGKTRDELTARGLHGRIAHKGEEAPIQASRRRQAGRTNAWHNAFNRLQRCYERREHVIDAFFSASKRLWWSSWSTPFRAGTPLPVSAG